MMCLCIGGSQDGEYLNFDPEQAGIRIPVRPEGAATMFVGVLESMPMPSPSFIEVERYRPHKWYVEGRTFILLALEGQSGRDVFVDLLLGYNRHGRKTS